MQTLAVTRARDQLGLDGGPMVALPIDIGPLVGTWVNHDERSTGVSRLEITDRDGAVAVHAFGADGSRADGGPPVDWGEVSGAAFSGGVILREAVGFTAEYDFGFLKVLLAARLVHDRLVVDAYSRFTDSSGRSSYYQRDHLYVH